MYSFVTNYVTLVMKAFVAYATLVRTFFGVSTDVYLQVEFFEERLAALGAFVIPLLEVIPLYVFLKRKFILSRIIHTTYEI